MENQEEQLIAKLRRIEALFARPGTDGERIAAELARDRIQARLEEIAQKEPAIEYRFSLTDKWSRRLLTALLRRYGITPYRYRGQRYTSVMAKVTKRFVDETLWPEFEELQATLVEYFDQFTERIIGQVLDADTSEVEERSEPDAQVPSLKPRKG